MARRIAVNSLNATTLDIMNVIRRNASYEYQQSVPVVEQASDVPHVGEIIYGTPALANQFINALVNRIALVRVSSATFNNPYAPLKKGYLEFGESVEDIFVSIAKAVDYNADKAKNREFQRTLPDVDSVFHVMNWRVMYPITIQDEDLKLAFLSAEGVTNLIANIVDSVYTAAEYDEFLLFKYLIIKAYTGGNILSLPITGETKNYAKGFRALSNTLRFMSTRFNAKGVRTNTPIERQIIFMNAIFNAEFDVEVLASAFNMNKADFIGRLFLIDDFSSFDNERFNVIRENSTGLEEVTNEELQVMYNVNALLMDENWFQIYDNLNKFTEKYVSSGLYWNYFYHVWKTISWSPFANAVAFVRNAEEVPQTYTVHIATKEESDEAIVLALTVEDVPLGSNSNVRFVQTKELTDLGIAVQSYGALLVPNNSIDESITLEMVVGEDTYKATAQFDVSTVTVDATVTMQKQ